MERRTDSLSQRLYYLGRYTIGEAKEAIRGLLALDSEDAYREARKILSDKFGNPILLANAYRKKIKFSDFLLHCQSPMKEIEYLKALNDPEENQKMLRKEEEGLLATTGINHKALEALQQKLKK